MEPIASWEISPKDLDESFVLIDIRESDEVASDPYLGGSYQHMPMSQFDVLRLDPSLKYALFCRSGRRSAKLVLSLRSQYNNLYSVIGGLEAMR